MKKTISCIDCLSSEAMQDRHWVSISKEIGHPIERTKNFCFRNIVDVSIYKYEN